MERDKEKNQPLHITGMPISSYCMDDIKKINKDRQTPNHKESVERESEGKRVEITSYTKLNHT